MFSVNHPQVVAWAGLRLKKELIPFRAVENVYFINETHRCYGFHETGDYCECDTDAYAVAQIWYLDLRKKRRWLDIAYDSLNELIRELLESK